MLKMTKNFIFSGFCIILFLSISVYAGSSDTVWDSERYIGIDEISAGMDAYCLTEYGTGGVERFELKVVDILPEIEPGRDAILVMGTDERFIHTGPVAGCSGSPVYIDGRLAGALAFTWPYTNDPLYGVTPIKDMLNVGSGLQSSGSVQSGIVHDFTVPINFAAVDRQLASRDIKSGRRVSGINYLPCPLVTSGLSAEVCQQLSDMVEPFGQMVVSGGGSGGGSEKTSVTNLVPGGTLAVPWVSGDITMTTIGTVTDVVGDKVYGFGHQLLGYGQIDLPMAAGKVHTIVSNMVSSFKLASPTNIVGALRMDESVGVIGELGAQAKMIPLKIRISRYNDAQQRVYDCQIANNEIFTQRYLRVVVAGAALTMGPMPPEHTVKYKVTVGIEGDKSISYENISTDSSLNDVLIESGGVVGLIMNNPYKKAEVESIEVDVNIIPKSIMAQIWSVELSDLELKGGESFDVDVVIQSVLADKKKYRFNLEIPENLEPGEYELTICGVGGYEQFLVKAAPYRFTAQSFPELLVALKNSLKTRRDQLFCVLELPPSGLAVEKAELPDFPATRMLVLQDAKRTLSSQPYQNWIEKSIKTGTIILDKKVIKIKVTE